VTPDVQVQVEVIRFDARSDRTVALHARWSVLDRTGATRVAARSDLDQRAAGGDYGALVAAHSEALARLSREIATKIAAAGI
jgi:uncharacterized lipoprotein YmbA